jgi:membrane-associated HD superfamily phosphohydrolase
MYIERRFPWPREVRAAAWIVIAAAIGGIVWGAYSLHEQDKARVQKKVEDDWKKDEDFKSKVWSNWHNFNDSRKNYRSQLDGEKDEKLRAVYQESIDKLAEHIAEMEQISQRQWCVHPRELSSITRTSK